MVLRATYGAVGFLTQLPVGHSERSWKALTAQPVAFPLVGYLVGALLALVFFLPLPAASVAVAFVLWLYLLTGINHLDGVTDLGDALVVHGDEKRRREVMRDTTIGVGGMASLVIVLLGLAAAAVQLATLPIWTAVGLVIVTEVWAKASMAALVCLGTAPHKGLGSQFTSQSGTLSLVPIIIVSVPALALLWPAVGPAVAVAATAAGVTLCALVWARQTLGGVSGDVLGATNELVRVVALHAGVIAWMHW